MIDAFIISEIESINMSNLDEQQKATIESMIARYENEPAHCRQVTKLALNIFDELKGKTHKYGKNERKLLEYASLLHDIGYSISWDKHNKHAYNIIMNESMPGFLPEEKEMIANIARYHRGKIPSKKHNNIQNIKDKAMISRIKKLSAIIRIADGLDRSHTNAVEDIKIVKDDFISKGTFLLQTKSINCPAELYAANKKKDLFEQEFNLELEFIVQYNI